MENDRIERKKKKDDITEQERKIKNGNYIERRWKKNIILKSNQFNKK